MERTKRIPVYLTEQEHQRIRIAAARAGLSMSDYLRKVSLVAAQAQEKRQEQSRATEQVEL